MLITTWLPAPRALANSRIVQFVGGSIVSAVGMVVGSKLLTRVPERVFRLAFRLLLSAVAIGLIREAFVSG